MRNKFLLLLFLCCWAGCITNSYPIETVPSASKRYAVEKVPEVPDSLKIFVNKSFEIDNDSLLTIAPIDTTRITAYHFQENFADRYAHDEDFDYLRGGGGKSLLQKMREWFGNLIRGFLGLSEVVQFNRHSCIFLNILYGIIALAALFIIVRLIINHKGRWFFEKEGKPLTINLANVEAHIHEVDFGELIRATEAAGDTRQSIRLYYLWLLKSFSDREIIDWQPEKTNADYTREMKDENRKKQFRYLSYLFNHIWYGAFSINDTEYRQARGTFLKQIEQNGK